MTDAHGQAMTLHVLAHIPEHTPRLDDPFHHLFEQAKARIKRQQPWKCAINDDPSGGGLEPLHSHVESLQANAVDRAKIEQAIGLHCASDENFQKWIERPPNLEVLCVNHHRTHCGVHVIPPALRETLRWHRAGQPPAVEFVAAKDLPGGAQ
jgi:hypothetical protein